MPETPYHLEYYLDDNGEAPFKQWLYSLRDKVAVYRIRARLDRVQLGNFGTVKPVGGGVSELKIDYGPGYRLYYAKEGCCYSSVATNRPSKRTLSLQRLTGNGKRRPSDGQKNR